MKRYPKKGRARWQKRPHRGPTRRRRVWHFDARQVRIFVNGLDLDSENFYEAPQVGYVRRYDPDGTTRDVPIDLAEAIHRDIDTVLRSTEKVPYTPGCFFCGVETFTGAERKPHATNCVMNTPKVLGVLEAAKIAGIIE